MTHHAPGSPLVPFLDDTAAPAFWPLERGAVASAWWGHIPFAHWLVAAIRPRRIVELGTHNGVSYAAFCEAVLRQGIDCRCTAIDTWEGDHQAGFYGEDVLTGLQAFHDPRYAAFSTLTRSTFAAAALGTPDASIDLLHIDGRHGYDDVRADFEQWRPKLSPRGVVLFHDTEVRTPGFGVWRYWAELAAQYPAFNFQHGFGLGVLAVGPEPPSLVQSLTTLDAATAACIRDRFAALGARFTAEYDAANNQAAALAHHAATLAHQAAAAADLDALRAAADQEATEAATRLDAQSRQTDAQTTRADIAASSLATAQHRLAALAATLDQQRAQATQAQAALAMSHAAALDTARAAAAQAEAALAATLDRERTRAAQAEATLTAALAVANQDRAIILASISWRATAPLRAVVHQARALVRR